MPFRSKAQRKRMYEMLQRGEIEAQIVYEMERETKGNLPERAAKKMKRRKKVRVI